MLQSTPPLVVTPPEVVSGLVVVLASGLVVVVVSAASVVVDSGALVVELDPAATEELVVGPPECLVAFEVLIPQPASDARQIAPVARTGRRCFVVVRIGAPRRRRCSFAHGRTVCRRARCSVFVPS